MSEELVNSIAGMREDEALTLVRGMLDGGEEPAVILEDAREAMDIVGQRFEAGEYFLPAALMAAGTPDEVKALCKELIEVAGKDGGFWLSNGCDVTHAKPENIRAMIAAGKEYGVY